MGFKKMGSLVMQKVIQHATDVGIKSTDFVQARKNNL